MTTLTESPALATALANCAKRQPTTTPAPVATLSTEAALHSTETLNMWSTFCKYLAVKSTVENRVISWIVFSFVLVLTAIILLPTGAILGDELFMNTGIYTYTCVALMVEFSIILQFASHRAGVKKGWITAKH